MIKHNKALKWRDSVPKMPLKGLIQISLVPEEALVFFRHLHFGDEVSHMQADD